MCQQSRAYSGETVIIVCQILSSSLKRCLVSRLGVGAVSSRFLLQDFTQLNKYLNQVCVSHKGR